MIHPTRPLAALAFTLLALGSAALPAFAADAPMKACRDDRQKFCASEKPGGGRIAACLKAHESELSEGCQAALGTLKQCAQEAKKICGEASDGDGGLRECVKSHADEFSAGCRGARTSR